MGSADMNDERAVVAESTARNFDISVGDRICFTPPATCSGWAIRGKSRTSLLKEHAELRSGPADLVKEMVLEDGKESSSGTSSRGL